MPRQSVHIRRRAAAWLAAFFILGTIVSPLAHYTWMEVSDAYASPMHHAGHSHDGPAVAEVAAEHVTCKYDEIFATADSVDVESSAAELPLACSGTALLPDRTPIADANERTIHPPGPPSA